GVATASAELWCLHVRYRPIGELSPDQNIQNCGHRKKPHNAPQCSSTIECRLNHALPNLAFAKVDANRDQCQPSKEYDRKNQKNHDSDIRIASLAANLQRQYKEPRNHRGCEQCATQGTQPVLSQQKPHRPFARVTHSLLLKPASAVKIE